MFKGRFSFITLLVSFCYFAFAEYIASKGFILTPKYLSLFVTLLGVEKLMNFLFDYLDDD